jgi:hypothetical protein
LGLLTTKNAALSSNLFKYFRYPLSACELLSIENNNALDLFLPDRQLTVDVKVIEEVEVET